MSENFIIIMIEVETWFFFQKSVKQVFEEDLEEREFEEREFELLDRNKIESFNKSLQVCPRYSKVHPKRDDRSKRN